MRPADRPNTPGEAEASPVAKRSNHRFRRRRADGVHEVTASCAIAIERYSRLGDAPIRKRTSTSPQHHPGAEAPSAITADKSAQPLQRETSAITLWLCLNQQSRVHQRRSEEANGSHAEPSNQASLARQMISESNPRPTRGNANARTVEAWLARKPHLTPRPWEAACAAPTSPTEMGGMGCLAGYKVLLHRRVRNAAPPLPGAMHPILPWAFTPPVARTELQLSASAEKDPLSSSERQVTLCGLKQLTHATEAAPRCLPHSTPTAMAGAHEPATNSHKPLERPLSSRKMGGVTGGLV